MRIGARLVTCRSDAGRAQKVHGEEMLCDDGVQGGDRSERDTTQVTRSEGNETAIELKVVVERKRGQSIFGELWIPPRGKNSPVGRLMVPPSLPQGRPAARYRPLLPRSSRHLLRSPLAMSKQFQFKLVLLGALHGTLSLFGTNMSFSQANLRWGSPGRHCHFRPGSIHMLSASCL